MPHPIEIIIKPLFQDIIEAYKYSFEITCLDNGYKSDEIPALQKTYYKEIASNIEKIFTAAATDINSYLNLYRIQPNQTIDEYKAIYYLGSVISRFLERSGNVELSILNSISMIHLLDYRLYKLNIKKPLLKKSMLRLIKQREMEKQTGETGCYLIYKCLGNQAKCEGL